MEGRRDGGRQEEALPVDRLARDGLCSLRVSNPRETDWEGGSGVQ